MNQVSIRADRDQSFADWGQAIVLRRVTQTHEPTTGALAEAYDDREVQAIAGDAELAAIVGTAGHAGRFAQLFLVRSEDVEQESNLRTMRVVSAGEQYRVDDVESQPRSGMMLLKCSRM